MKKNKKQQLITGRQPVMEAINAGKSIERIFLSKRSSGEIIGELTQIAKKKLVPVSRVPEEKLNRLHPARRSGKANDQGCVAIVSKVDYLDLQDVISHVMEQGETPLFVLVDGVTDVRNIGAMARSAFCCGAQAMVIPQKGVASLNEEAVKSSAGALAHIAVCRVSYLKEAVKVLQLNGFQIIVSDGAGDTLLQDCDWSLPTAVVMGAEDSGVHPSIRKAADQVFKIPMAVDFDSFNVSVATGIVLYEAMKARMGD